MAASAGGQTCHDTGRICLFSYRPLFVACSAVHAVLYDLGVDKCAIDFEQNEHKLWNCGLVNLAGAGWEWGLRGPE